MECKICANKAQKQFESKILGKYKISYYYCSNCGFMQTEEPFWLDEAYKEPINLSDVGLVKRNIALSKILSSMINFYFGNKGKYLDYAGGAGLFTRLMRDIGFDFYWYDPYAENIFARGFEFQNNFNPDAVTAFEAFEHFTNPMEEIEKIINISTNIIFTTESLPDKPPLPQEWWYYGLDHGQHISFYSKKTLKRIAAKYGLNYYESGSLHMFTRKRVNNNIFKLLAKISNTPINVILKAGVKSKLFDDFNLLKKEL